MTPDELRKAIAANILVRRKELGITEQALGTAVGVSAAHICQVENAKANVSIVLLAQIATALGTLPSALVTPRNFVKNNLFVA